MDLPDLIFYAHLGLSQGESFLISTRRADMTKVHGMSFRYKPLQDLRKQVNRLLMKESAREENFFQVTRQPGSKEGVGGGEKVSQSDLLSQKVVFVEFLRQFKVGDACITFQLNLYSEIVVFVLLNCILIKFPSDNKFNLVTLGEKGFVGIFNYIGQALITIE